MERVITLPPVRSDIYFNIFSTFRHRIEIKIQWNPYKLVSETTKFTFGAFLSCFKLAPFRK